MRSIKVADVSPAYTHWSWTDYDTSYHRLRSDYAMDKMLKQDKDSCWHHAGSNVGYYMPTAMFRIIPTSTQK